MSASSKVVFSGQWCLPAWFQSTAVTVIRGALHSTGLWRNVLEGNIFLDILRADFASSQQKNEQHTSIPVLVIVRRAEMHAGRVACCPLVSYGEYADGTDRRTPDITLSARRGQRKKCWQRTSSSVLRTRHSPRLCSRANSPRSPAAAPSHERPFGHSAHSGWLRGTAVERRSVTGELSLSYARPVADGWPLMSVNRPPQVSQLGQLSLSSFRGR